jgi:hypothetical protein
MPTYIEPDAVPFPAPGHVARVPLPPVGRVGEDTGPRPFNPYTGAPIYDLDEYMETERREEAEARAAWQGPVGEREELAKTQENLVGLRVASVEAEDAMTALGKFDTKTAEGNLEDVAAMRRTVRRRWADAVYAVEMSEAVIVNLQRSIKTTKFTFYRRPVVWR